MTQSVPRSVIVVGAGITGLTIAVALQASGHKVTLIARDAPEDTASGVAAGMIAPAMEAMNEPDPAFSFHRLKAAQMTWQDLMPLWPESLRYLWPEVLEGHSYFVWPGGAGEVPESLHHTGLNWPRFPMICAMVLASSRNCRLYVCPATAMYRP